MAVRYALNNAAVQLFCRRITTLGESTLSFIVSWLDYKIHIILQYPQ